MVTDNGTDFLLDLPQATELVHGNDLVLDDGRHVRSSGGERIFDEGYSQ